MKKSFRETKKEVETHNHVFKQMNFDTDKAKDEIWLFEEQEK